MNEKHAKKILVAFMACILASQPSLAYAYVDTLQEAESERNTSNVRIRFDQPFAAIGKPLRVYVEGADQTTCTYAWKVDGKVSTVTQDTFTPKKSDMQKLLTVIVKTADGIEVAKDILVSELPVVYINIENGQEVVDKEKYLPADMRIQGNESWTVEDGAFFEGAIEIKGRGNSTWGQPKKPYKLKLGEKSDLFGMGKSKHWVLLANYTDHSLLRNTLAYDLSAEMGMPHMQTVWVDVVMNGQKVGNYQLCEQIRIDSERVNIFNWEDASADLAKAVAKKEGLSKDIRDEIEDALNENMAWVTSGSFTFQGKKYTVKDYYEVPDINGGYLLELDEYFDEVSKFKTNSGQPLMFKTPEFVGTNNEMVKYVQNYIQAFEDALANHTTFTANYDGNMQHYSDLFDMDALVDFWLLQELFFNEDSMKKSTYLYKDIDDTFHMGPIWDMDWSSHGQGDTWRYDAWQTEYFNINAQARQWYKDLIKDPYFVMKAQERYWELHDKFVELVETDGKIDTFEAYLYTSAIENCNRWYGGKNTFNSSVATLKTWMTNRINWLDQQFDTKTSILNAFKLSNNTISVDVTDQNGNALPADTSDHKILNDGLVPFENDIRLYVENSKADAVRVFVNGKVLVDEAFKEQSDITIPYASFDMQKGNSVVELRLYRSNVMLGSRILTFGKEAPQAEALEITLPTKVVYELDETFDETGMLIQARMNDGSMVDVSDAEVKGFDSSTPGEKTITVSWRGLEATFTVTVLEAHVTSLSIDAIKDTYVQGAPFDYSALKVSAHMSDQSVEDVSAFVEVENFDSSQLGEYTIILRYEGVSVETTITILQSADKTALQTAIDECEGFMESDAYKQSNASDQEALKVLLSISRVWLEAPTSDQIFVDSFTKQLRDKVEEMRELYDHKAALKAQLDHCATLQASNYTKHSWNALQVIYEEAESIWKVAVSEVALAEASERLQLHIDQLVNVEALSIAIQTAKDLQAVDYTQQSYAVLTQVLEDVQAVFADGTQDDVDQAIRTVYAAIKQLQPVVEKEGIEKQILTSAIEKAILLQSAGFDHLAKAALANFDDALKQAVDVLGNAEATPDTMMEAWFHLANAMQYLDFRADKTQLTELMVKADDIYKKILDYKEEGRQAFINAYMQAKAIIASDTALDVSINQAYQRLTDTISKLQPIRELDTTILKYFMQLAEEAIADEVYFEHNAAWETFVQAYEHAKDVYANAENQQAINMAAITLASAYEDIRLIPDEEHLKELATLKFVMDQAKQAIDEAAYYEQDEAWNTFIKAYEDAERLYMHANSRKALRNATFALADAYENIRLVANEDRLKTLQHFINEVAALNRTFFSNEDYAILHDAKMYAQELLTQKKFSVDAYRQFEETKIIVDALIVQNQVQQPSITEDTKAPENTEVAEAPKSVETTTLNDIKPATTTKTGDVTNVSAILAAMLTSIGGAFALRKKRKK